MTSDHVMTRGRRAIGGTALLSAALLFGSTSVALAQDAASTSPLRNGSYAAAMGGVTLTDDDAFDGGSGGTFALGYRDGWWAFEISGVLSSVDWAAAGGGKSEMLGATVNALVFPWSKADVFGLIGVGGLDVEEYPGAGRGYSLTTAEAGLGYIFPISLGRYHFGIRADARYRYGRREDSVMPGRALNVANDFTDILINAGLQLPLGLAAPAVSPAPEPVQVVAPVTDADGDGVFDDADQCPGTAAGAQVDVTGCPLPPPPPPCKTPAPGEKVSLAGCGTGDVIVLRGVNFEYNQARLTANAKTILDNVAEELVAHPSIEVELSGHTDSSGSDAYNQTLSKKRAQAVLEYLEGKGVEASRIGAIGVGEAQPVADNETEEGRELNRRVELRVTAGNAGKAAADAAQTAFPAADPVAAPSPAPEAGNPAEQTPAEPAPPSTPVNDDLDFLN